MNEFRYPTPEQVDAIERSARRARAEELARLAKAAVTGVKSLFGKATTRVDMKRPHHA